MKRQAVGVLRLRCQRDLPANKADKARLFLPHVFRTPPRPCAIPTPFQCYRYLPTYQKMNAQKIAAIVMTAGGAADRLAGTQ